MTPQFILKQSLCREAHCYHGEGRERAAISEIENLGFASKYSEPGYSDPTKGILFANWNVFPRNIDTVLEKYGFAVEWSDEWANCCDCNGAVRMSPDSYSRTPAYVLLNDCEIICRDCLDREEYLSTLEDQHSKACPDWINPEEFGYSRLSSPGEFENGLHHGQNDKPKDILAQLKAQGKTGVLFRISGKGQFEVCFETWMKNPEVEPSTR